MLWRRSTESTMRALVPPLVALIMILVPLGGVLPDGAGHAAGRGAGCCPRRLPSLTALARTPIIAPHTWQTLVETLIGFALALVVGLGFAVLIDISGLLRRAIYPLLVVSQTIPILAIAPLLVLWFGFGLLPKVLIVALVCFFPIVVAGADGLMATDPELVRLFRTFGASKWTIFRQVRFPGALPALFSGIRIAITYSVIGAVWGEYVGADVGLGIFIQRAQHSTRLRWCSRRSRDRRPQRGALPADIDNRANCDPLAFQGSP